MVLELQIVALRFGGWRVVGPDESLETFEHASCEAAEGAAVQHLESNGGGTAYVRGIEGELLKVFTVPATRS